MAVSRPLQFTEATRADIAAAYDWYEESSAPGWVRSSGKRVDRCVYALSEFSEAGPTVHLTCVASLLRRFPYAAYYRVVGTVIEVHGCLHLHRDRARGISVLRHNHGLLAGVPAATCCSRRVRCASIKVRAHRAPRSRTRIVRGDQMQFEVWKDV